jgi:hypothetical protein
MWAPEPVTPARIQSGSATGVWLRGNSSVNPADMERLATPTTTMLAIVNHRAG